MTRRQHQGHVRRVAQWRPTKGCHCLASQNYAEALLPAAAHPSAHLRRPGQRDHRPFEGAERTAICASPPDQLQSLSVIRCRARRPRRVMLYALEDSRLRLSSVAPISSASLGGGSCGRPVIRALRSRLRENAWRGDGLLAVCAGSVLMISIAIAAAAAARRGRRRREGGRCRPRSWPRLPGLRLPSAVRRAPRSGSAANMRCASWPSSRSSGSAWLVSSQRPVQQHHVRPAV